jgi:lytic murein transglycosylase
MRNPMRIPAMALLLGFAVWAAPALAAGCPGTGSFETWLETFKRKAVAQGISQSTVNAALENVTYDPGIVSRDRGQGVFRQSFEEFSSRMVNGYRLKKGAALIRRYGEIFRRVEKQFGVPAPVIAALWGLETDFGAGTGHFNTIRSLATLAYDCRRSAMFTAELIAALRLLDAGDLSLDEMHGAWAGEIGQAQFMPTSYLKFAVDYEGNGHRDLIRSVPDVIASIANYLQSYGWQRGQPWDEGTANFQVLLVWNKSTVYTKTVAYLADRLAGTAEQ